jgi:hypothetical protein
MCHRQCNERDDAQRHTKAIVAACKSPLYWLAYRGTTRPQRARGFSATATNDRRNLREVVGSAPILNVGRTLDTRPTKAYDRLIRTELRGKPRWGCSAGGTPSNRLLEGTRIGARVDLIAKQMGGVGGSLIATELVASVVLRTAREQEHLHEDEMTTFIQGIFADVMAGWTHAANAVHVVIAGYLAPRFRKAPPVDGK